MKSTNTQRFVDKVRVRIQAGNGGNGCSSFYRGRNLPRGGPDGGDGGRGGDVTFEATTDEQSLTALMFLNHYEAGDGGHGTGANCRGKDGNSIVVKVPVGSIIREINENGEVGEDLADLSHPDDRYVAVTGGQGGKGNVHFTSSTNQSPRRSEEGVEGAERHLELELKLIADVALVGFPNAGKSTFLGAVSNATPEVAPYPFTTLTPNIGVVEPTDYERYTIADVPGLIEGAHDNVGLGHDFLRHVERTKIILYVLDMAGTDGRNPWDDFAALQYELECYQRGMTKRPSLIIANKMDGEMAADNLETLRGLTDVPLFPACAVLGENVEAITDELWRILQA